MTSGWSRYWPDLSLILRRAMNVRDGIIQRSRVVPTLAVYASATASSSLCRVSVPTAVICCTPV